MRRTKKYQAHSPTKLACLLYSITTSSLTILALASHRTRPPVERKRYYPNASGADDDNSAVTNESVDGRTESAAASVVRARSTIGHASTPSSSSASHSSSTAATMSSSLSHAKQAFKDKLGQSVITMDEQFSSCWNNIQVLDEVIERVRSHMQHYIEAMKHLCMSGHAVSDDFKTFYERQSSRLTTIAIKYEMIQHGFRTEKIQLLERLITQNVYIKLDDFKVELSSLRTKVEDREVSRKRYDHYLAKITELRDMSSRAKAKGKDLKSGDMDKLVRNERKFEEARLEYVAVNHLVTKALWTAWSKRYIVLDPIFNEILKIKANFTLALSNQLQGIVLPLKQQMAVELQEEVVPAVFQLGKKQPTVDVGDDTNGEDYDTASRRVMSPGGTTEMDSKKVNAKMQKITRKSKAAQPEPEEEEEVAEEEDENSAAAVAAKKAKLRKLKAAKAAAAAAAAAEEEEEEDLSSEDEAIRKKKKPAATKAVATKKATASPPVVTKKSKATDNLDFLVDVVAAESTSAAVATKKTKKATAAGGATPGGIDLLSFAGTAPAKTKKQQPGLELDSFFTSSGALMPPPSSGGDLIPDTSDPFFNLPTASPSAPVDLLSMPQGGKDKLSRQQSNSSTAQPGLFDRPPSNTNGETATKPKAKAKTKPKKKVVYSSDESSDTSSEDSETDGTPAAEGRPTSKRQASNMTSAARPGYNPAAAMAAANAGAMAAAAINARKQGGGGAAAGGTVPAQRTGPPPIPKQQRQAPVAVPAAQDQDDKHDDEANGHDDENGGGADPFDFESHPTPSQREELSASASSREAHEANRVASAASHATQSPKKTQKHPKVNPHAAPLASRGIDSPQAPPVPELPIGGLPDLHISTSVTQPLSTKNSNTRPSAYAQPAPAAVAAAEEGEEPQPTPEPYTPTRDDYNPHHDPDQKKDDPFGGVNEDW